MECLRCASVLWYESRPPYLDNPSDKFEPFENDQSSMLIFWKKYFHIVYVFVCDVCFLYNFLLRFNGFKKCFFLLYVQVCVLVVVSAVVLAQQPFVARPGLFNNPYNPVRPFVPNGVLPTPYTPIVDYSNEINVDGSYRYR